MQPLHLWLKLRVLNDAITLLSRSAGGRSLSSIERVQGRSGRFVLLPPQRGECGRALFVPLVQSQATHGHSRSHIRGARPLFLVFDSSIEGTDRGLFQESFQAGRETKYRD